MGRSKFMRLNFNDILKSMLIIVLSTTLFSLYPLLQAGNLPDTEQLKSGFIAGLCAGISYLIKNVFTNSNGEILKNENGDLL